VAMGTGVEQTLSGITYKTYAAPVAEVRQASLTSLRRMQMTVTEDRASEAGWSIKATASDRTIEIALEQLTPNTTRMRVDVDKGSLFFKDAATATEIMMQTAQTLDEKPTAAPVAAKATKRS
jgi:hypothetical protein